MKLFKFWLRSCVKPQPSFYDDPVQCISWNRFIVTISPWAPTYLHALDILYTNKNSEMEVIADIFYCFEEGKLYTFRGLHSDWNIQIYYEIYRNE